MGSPGSNFLVHVVCVTAQSRRTTISMSDSGSMSRNYSSKHVSADETKIVFQQII